MGRGYFPLSKYDFGFDGLTNLVSVLRDIRKEYIDDIYSGIDGQFDNAASDGGYLERLLVAEDLIRSCIEVENK